MRISTIGYSAKQGVKNIGRNKMFSLASIATMSACIFIFGLFFAIITNFQHIVHKAEESVAITVFFDEEITLGDFDINGIIEADKKSYYADVTHKEAYPNGQPIYITGEDFIKFRR